MAICKTVFCETMGEAPTIKVLEYLLMWDGHDVTITDIARESKVGRAQAYEIVGKLLEKGVIEQTRVVGASRFYQLNKSSPITKSLLMLFSSILHESVTSDLNRVN